MFWWVLVKDFQQFDYLINPVDNPFHRYTTRTTLHRPAAERAWYISRMITRTTATDSCVLNCVKVFWRVLSMLFAIFSGLKNVAPKALKTFGESWAEQLQICRKMSSISERYGLIDLWVRILWHSCWNVQPIYFIDKIGFFWDLKGQKIIGMNWKRCLWEGVRMVVRIY